VTFARVGSNYDRAEFRLWCPDDPAPRKAILVLVPGSNADGRSLVEDSVWRKFATTHKLALVGCRFTDKRHSHKSFIEQYVQASQGSGQALLDALVAFSRRWKRPELADAPLLLWGMSAGGAFNYEFVAWRPERVVAFVVNKGGIYYSALVPQSSRDVPGILFTGEKDLEFRTNIIAGLFAVNRRAGALWALAEEPGTGHVAGRSLDMALIFFEDLLTLRLGGPFSSENQRTAPAAILEKNGFIGDLKSKTFQAAKDVGLLTSSTAWLPTLRIARAWQALITGTPFDR
jgi:hypothetical protein